jgi:L-seryl-tRNA(Ser) seleniumtransferase
MKLRGKVTRRDIFRAGGTGAAAGLLAGPMASPAAAAPEPAANPYLKIGVRPFINTVAAFTINGGLQTRPEVKQAMEQASYYSVNLDELMEKVGARIAQLLGAEGAIVTSGCAAALAHATTASIAGGDPEKIQQLPRLEGLKDEVIMPRQSRNPYDHAVRMVGVKIVNVDSRDEFYAALSNRTAMVVVLGTAEPEGKVRLEEICEAARKRNIPVLVDGAPEIPKVPNPYLSRGADLVAYSGGKFLGGPQCAGLLLGRKDLVQAAWINSAPHHAFGRPMKAGKEEIMGMLAGVEAFVKRDLEAERRAWEAGLAQVAERLAKVAGVRTGSGSARRDPESGAGPFPELQVAWDSSVIGLTAGELGAILLQGEPRIMTLAAGEGTSFRLRASSNIKPGDYHVIADRLYEVFRQAPKGKLKAAPRAPAADVSGRWDVEMEFVRGSSRHTLLLEARGNRLSGMHLGSTLKGDLSGSIDGDAIRMSSSFPIEGTRLTYTFTGTLASGRMSGDVALGEYGSGRWTARRPGAG